MVFLQPLLPDKHPRTFAEGVRLATTERRQPGLTLFAAAVTPALAALDTASLPVRDLGTLFAVCPEPRYQDFVHLDPAGNRAVAEAIAAQLVALGLLG